MKRPMMIEGRPFIKSRVSRIGPAAGCRVLGQEERDQNPERHRNRRRDATITPVPSNAGPTPVGSP